MNEQPSTPSEDTMDALHIWIERNGGDPDSAPQVFDLMARTITQAREYPDIDAHTMAKRATLEVLTIAAPKNRPSNTPHR